MPYKLFQADYPEIKRSASKYDSGECKKGPSYPTINDYFRKKAEKSIGEKQR